MKQVNPHDRVELRKFAFAMVGAFAILTALRWWWRGSFSWIGGGVALAFFVFGLVAPGILSPVYIVWMRIADGMNWVMTRVLLSIAFYALITPTRILHQYFSSDALKRNWEPNSETYWEPAEEQPDDLDSYKRQF